MNNGLRMFLTDGSFLQSDIGQVEIVTQMGLLGVNIVDLLDDDFSTGSCESAEFPLVKSINYALRNNMSRPMFTSSTRPGFVLIRQNYQLRLYLTIS
jgi:hypothetical protein